MFDDYCALFFDTRPDPKERIYGDGTCVGVMISDENIQQMEVTPVDGWVDEKKQEPESTLPDPRTKAAIWAKYRYRQVHFCEDIAVDGITISSRVNGNGDGLDFDGCPNARVANSSFDTSDDSICLQSSRMDESCENVTTGNCLFSSKWAGLRIGLLACGDRPYAGRRSRIHHLTFSDIASDSVNAPVDSRKDSAIILMGLSDLPLEKIRLEGIAFLSAGGGTETDAAGLLPEFTKERLAGWWPEYHCFERTVPAFGLYAASVRDLQAKNLDLAADTPDARRAMIFSNVTVQPDRLDGDGIKEPYD